MGRTRRVAISVLLTMLVHVVSGCATSPIEISAKDLQADVTTPRRPRNPALPLVVAGPVEDRRRFVGGRSVSPGPAEGTRAATTHDGAAGGIAGRTVSTVGLPEQVHSELVKLSSPSFDILGDEEAGAEPASLVLHPRLLKAYVGGVNVTITAVVVIEIEYAAADGTTSTRAYRGQHSSMNWVNAKGEVTFSMRRALATCLEQIQADLESRIQST